MTQDLVDLGKLSPSRTLLRAPVGINYLHSAHQTLNIIVLTAIITKNLPALDTGHTFQSRSLFDVYRVIGSSMMPHALYPTCPPIKSGMPKLGETRTLPSGYLEYKEAISGDWKPAIRLNDVRGTLIANAAVQGVYTHDHGAGEEADNVTAYLPTDKDFGGDFADRPPALKQIERRADQHKKKPKGVKTHLGRVLLDPYDYPIRDFPELPSTLSTEMKGWEVEHHLRKNLAIKPYDLMALCMSNFIDGKGKPHEGPPRIASLTEKATKFRRKAGLPSLKIKPGSDNINNYIKSLLPLGAETLEELKGDLDPEEVKASRAMNAGKYPNRRKKAKREEEARARAGPKNQLGDQKGRQSAQVESSFAPAVTGGDYANGNLSVLLVGKQVNEPKSLKRGRSEISPEAYPEDGPRPSKIQRHDTVASELKLPPRRRLRTSRNTNTVLKQPRQVAKDLSQFPIEPIGADALQPGTQEDGTSFNHSDLWCTLALDAEEVANPTPTARSNFIEPKPWDATRAFDGKLYSSLTDDLNPRKSNPGHVGELRHPNSINHQPCASSPTKSYTSHSNSPAHHVIIAESSQWMHNSTTPFADSITIAAPRVSLDHAMASAYPNAGPASRQYSYQDSYQYSGRIRSSGYSYHNAHMFPI